MLLDVATYIFVRSRNVTEEITHCADLAYLLVSFLRVCVFIRTLDLCHCYNCFLSHAAFFVSRVVKSSNVLKVVFLRPHFNTSLEHSPSCNKTVLSLLAGTKMKSSVVKDD